MARALTGAIGQVLAGLELVEGAAAHGFSPDAVVLPSATGGTQAGLLVGLATAGAGTAVLGYAVARPADELRARVAELVAELATVPGLAPVPGRRSGSTTQLGPGYGVATSSAAEAASLLATTEGILVDPIYTAKALAGLIALVRGGELDGQRVVFWHAGGTTGLFEPLDP